MATLKIFDEFFNDLLKAKHNFSTGHVFKCRLSNVAPTKASDTAITSKTVASGTGYPGDQTVTLTITEPSTGTWQLGDTTNVTFTASGGDFGPFQYAYLYNDTDSGDALIAVLDYGSAVTSVTSTNSFIVDPGTNGWVQFATPAWS